MGGFSFLFSSLPFYSLLRRSKEGKERKGNREAKEKEKRRRKDFYKFSSLRLSFPFLSLSPFAVHLPYLFFHFLKYICFLILFSNSVFGSKSSRFYLLFLITKLLYHINQSKLSTPISLNTCD